MTERIFVLDETDFHLQLEEADAGLSSAKAAALTASAAEQKAAADPAKMAHLIAHPISTAADLAMQRIPVARLPE
jgi:multidrug resistance efflux pump